MRQGLTSNLHVGESGKNVCPPASFHQHPPPAIHSSSRIHSLQKESRSARKRMEVEDKLRQQVLTSSLAEDKSPTKSADEILETCVICLDSISERAAASPCKHDTFDFLCLVSWLQERSTCPLCQTEVLAVDYGWSSPQGCKTYRVPRSRKQTEGSESRIYGQSRNASNPNRHHYTYPRSRRPARPRSLPKPGAALLRRRQVYAQGLYSLHVGTNRLSQYRDLNPQLFSRDEELVRRARKWIRRELQVFEFLSIDGGREEGVTRRTNNAEFLLEYIIAILKTVDIKGSGGQAEDMLQEFLGRANTQLFLHELKAWLRSPYTSLEDWDRHVQYADTTTRFPNHQTKSGPPVYRYNDRAHSASTTTSNAPCTPSSSSTNHRSSDRYRPYPNPKTTRRLGPEP